MAGMAWRRPSAMSPKRPSTCGRMASRSKLRIWRETVPLFEAETQKWLDQKARGARRGRSRRRPPLKARQGLARRAAVAGDGAGSAGLAFVGPPLAQASGAAIPSIAGAFFTGSAGLAAFPSAQPGCAIVRRTRPGAHLWKLGSPGPSSRALPGCSSSALEQAARIDAKRTRSLVWPLAP